MKTHPHTALALASLLAAALAAAAPLTASEVATEGAEIGHWTMDFAAATQLAEEKELPLLVNFTGSDWCGWCKRMDSAVFAQEAWKDYADDNLVLVTIDFPQDSSIVPEQYKQRNEKLKNQFGIRGYPTYIILDSDADTVLGQLGAGADKTPESFIDEVENVLRFRPANIEAKVEELGEELGEEYRAAIETVKSSIEELEQWIATGPQKTPENTEKYEGLREAISEAVEELEKF